MYFLFRRYIIKMFIIIMGQGIRIEKEYLVRKGGN
nr:MAG TPA: hypothetical protein [Caudoviricetes sp.]DAS86131.1 MAG TPA: hypothetical protein [Caudoviricetes sp.]